MAAWIYALLVAVEDVRGISYRTSKHFSNAGLSLVDVGLPIILFEIKSKVRGLCAISSKPKKLFCRAKV